MATLTVQAAHPVDFDDEMMALALQLEEIDCQPSLQKGKYRADSPTDLALAFSTFQKEVQTHIQFMKDLTFAHSIARAVDADAQAIAESLRGEGREQQDRRLAFQLSGQNPDDAPPPYAEEPSASSARGDNFGVGLYAAMQLQALGQLPTFFEDDEEESTAGPSSSYADRQLRGFEKLAVSDAQCIACIEIFRSMEVVSTPCGSTYCKECLKRVFMNATKDEELFPPRSLGKALPLDLAAPFMSSDELALFKEKEVEYSFKNRIYCSDHECGRFIHPNGIVNGDRARCVHCGKATCVHCKQESHEGDCPQDEALQAMLALAEQENWRRCPNCDSMVELRTGCYHMTCRCKAQFCYVCGLFPWREHNNCEVWEEENLIERAEEVVDREALQPLAPEERQIRVTAMRRELLEQHECSHPGKFQRIDGYSGGKVARCEFCNARHRIYLLRCRHCHVQICQNCRNNRV